MNISVEQGVAKGTVKILNEILLTELQRSARFEEVIGQQDISALLTLEEERQKLQGCVDDSCLAEIGGALGVPFLISSSVGQVGDQFVLTMKLMSVKDARVIGRSSVITRPDEGELLAALKRALPEAVYDPLDSAAAARETKSDGTHPERAHIPAGWFWMGCGKPKTDPPPVPTQVHAASMGGRPGGAPPSTEVHPPTPTEVHPLPLALAGLLLILLGATGAVLLRGRPRLTALLPAAAGLLLVACSGAQKRPDRMAWECRRDEKPGHWVWLAEYLIDRTEVTVAQFRACVQAGHCVEPPPHKNCNYGQAERDDHPINCVAHQDAEAYCAWAGGRLPTEAQWERAARGTTGQAYPWGDAPATCLHAVMREGRRGCGQDNTWGVCRKPAGHSPEEVCDLAGNVWEWNADWFGGYARPPARNPRGPAAGRERVLRGGAWGSKAGGVRGGIRRAAAPERRDRSVGFRCAATPGSH